MVYDVLDIAEYIIAKCNMDEEYISNLKLQKVLYFVQAEFLLVKDEPCFKQKIVAWDFGPVVEEVYMKYRFYGAGFIPYFDKKHYVLNRISRKDRKLIDGIVEQCYPYSATTLVELTHKQRPWKFAYYVKYNHEITNESLKEYFRDE